MSEIKPWKKLEESVVLDSEFMKIRKDVCQLPSGMIMQDCYVRDEPVSVVVVCITKSGQFVLVRQYRKGSERITLEFPGGYVTRHDMNVTEAARRELLEETGYAADDLVETAALWKDETASTGKVHFFLARDAEKVSAPKHTDHEYTEVELTTKEEVEKMLSGDGFGSVVQRSAWYAAHTQL